MDKIIEEENINLTFGDGDYKRCWACDSLCHNKSLKIEQHHIFGKDMKEDLPLCIICHDLVDRMSLDDIEPFLEFMKSFTELQELPRGKTKYTKLFLLKMIKGIQIIKKKNDK